MKKLVVLLITAAALTFFNSAFCQTIDSLALPTAYIQPGDTARIPVYLTNNSFPVAGFTLRLMLSDSLNAEFVGCLRGENVGEFAYFEIHRTQGWMNIIGIANFPHYDPIPPLPLGRHEIAILRLRISPDAEYGSYININFNHSDEPTNFITDSTGYSVVQPYTVDGAIIVGSQAGIDESEPIPLEFELGDNYPNPFNARTIIEYSLKDCAHVSLEIFDLLGRRVASLVDEYAKPGNYQIVWNGTNDSGQSLASGIYFYNLSVGGKKVTKSLNFLK